MAAVTVPSLLKAGRRDGIFSMLAENGCSSRSTTVSPLRVFTVTETISSANVPSSFAFRARVSDRIAKSSCSARVNWVLLGSCLGEVAHELARFVGVFQPIDEHVVLQFRVAHAESRPNLGDHVGRV